MIDDARRPAPTAEDIGYECDWGNCPREAVALRWNDSGEGIAAWLPVCVWHRSPESVDYGSLRPAASGGATDGEREAHTRLDDEYVKPRYPVDEPPTYRARCTCGWIGPERYRGVTDGDWQQHVPVASQADGELREELAHELGEWLEKDLGSRGLNWEPGERVAGRMLDDSPAVRRLLADAAKVQRVEKVTEFVAACSVGIAPRHAAVYQDIEARLRRALDGDR